MSIVTPVFHFSLCFKLSIFFRLVYFLWKFIKEERKKLIGKKMNVDRQFFKLCYQHFLMLLCDVTNLIVEGQYQFLGKSATYFPDFNLVTSSPLK